MTIYDFETAQVPNTNSSKCIRYTFVVEKELIQWEEQYIYTHNFKPIAERRISAFFGVIPNEIAWSTIKIYGA